MSTPLVLPNPATSPGRYWRAAAENAIADWHRRHGTRDPRAGSDTVPAPTRAERRAGRKLSRIARRMGITT